MQQEDDSYRPRHARRSLRHAALRIRRRVRRLTRRDVILAAALGVAAAAVIAAVVALVSPKAEQPGETEVTAIDTTGTQRAVAYDEEVVPVTQAPQSTPKDEWHQGSMPYLYQIDPQYKDYPYSNGTLEKQGCGPTSLSMVYIDLTGDTTYGSTEMADFATENGYSTDGDGSSWLLMSEGAEKLGLASTSVANTPEALAAELEAGHPIICNMAPGIFTKVGHYIAIEGLDDEGKALVHDSNSRARSLWHWDLSIICEQARAIWSFSVA